MEAIVANMVRLWHNAHNGPSEHYKNMGTVLTHSLTDWLAVAVVVMVKAKETKREKGTSRTQFNKV